MKDRAIEMVANAYFYLFMHVWYAPIEANPAMNNLWDAYQVLYRAGARRIPPPYRYGPLQIKNQLFET